MTFGSRGDAEPYAALGQRLAAAGHHVRLVTHAMFAGLVEGTGVELWPARGRSIRDLIDSPEIQALLDGIRNPLRLRQLVPLVEPDLAALYEDTYAGVRGADVVVASPSTFTGLPALDAAEAARVPLVQSQLQPLTATGAFPAPSAGWLAARSLGRPANRATFAVDEVAAALLTRSMANRCRRRVLGLDPLSVAGMRERLRPIHGALVAVSPHVIPRPPDWPDSVRLTGWWWRPPVAPALPAEVDDFLAAGDPPVLFSLGSMPVKDPRQVTETVTAAARDAGVRLILQQGWSGLGTGEPAPTGSGDLLIAGDLPHDAVFPRVRAVVHHGGAGTTGRALLHGRPSMAVPSFSDQFFWGHRIAESGAGPAALPLARLSRPALAERFLALATHPGYRTGASGIGARLQAEDGCGRAVEALEELTRSVGLPARPVPS